MLILVLRLLAPLTEIAHERAHVACETLVYATVSPEVQDDATTPLGEAIAESLCRWDGAP